MLVDTIPLHPSRRDVLLKCYLQDRHLQGELGLRPAVVICPGGGFSGFIACEGEPLAIAFSALGYQAFVFEHSLGQAARLPQPFAELDLACLLIEKNSIRWQVDSERILLAGIGSGGFVASGYACLKSTFKSQLRIGALALLYPMLTIDTVTAFLKQYGDEGNQRALEFTRLLIGESNDTQKWNITNLMSSEIAPICLWKRENYIFSNNEALGELVDKVNLVGGVLEMAVVVDETPDITWAMWCHEWFMKEIAIKKQDQ